MAEANGEALAGDNPEGIQYRMNDDYGNPSPWDDTVSIASSITNYRMENGRRYHAYKDGVYWFPNDEKANEQLDIAHHQYTLLQKGELLLAPIEKDAQVHVLDIGTGTGIWAIDFADEYSNSIVLGTDLSPIQPAWVPPNCKFLIEDVNDEWDFPEQFDLIHIRMLMGCVYDWPALYKQALDHLNPGGWIEQFEINLVWRSIHGPVKPDSAMAKWSTYFYGAGDKTGRTFRVADEMKANIEKAGFVNVTEKVFTIPVGDWPADPRLRELGQWAMFSFLEGLEGFALAVFSRVWNWSLEEVQSFLAELRSELKSRTLHPYHYVHIVYAQKPE